MNDESRLLRALLGGAVLSVLAAAAPACLRVEHGIEVHLAVSWIDGAPSAELPLGDGGGVRVEHAVAMIHHVSLQRCELAVDEPSLRQTLNLLMDRLLPRAMAQHAHGGSGGTELDASVQLDWQEQAVHVGTFTPPPGHYCALEVVLDNASGPALVAAGDSAEGTPWLAWSDVRGPIRMSLGEPLDLSTRGSTSLEAFLMTADPFAGLGRMPEDATALGDLIASGGAGPSVRVAGSDPHAHHHHH